MHHHDHCIHHKIHRDNVTDQILVAQNATDAALTDLHHNATDGLYIIDPARIWFSIGGRYNRWTHNDNGYQMAIWVNNLLGNRLGERVCVHVRPLDVVGQSIEIVVGYLLCASQELQPIHGRQCRVDALVYIFASRIAVSRGYVKKALEMRKTSSTLKWKLNLKIDFKVHATSCLFEAVRCSLKISLNDFYIQITVLTPSGSQFRGTSRASCRWPPNWRVPPLWDTHWNAPVNVNHINIEIRYGVGGGSLTVAALWKIMFTWAHSSRRFASFKPVGAWFTKVTQNRLCIKQFHSYQSYHPQCCRENSRFSGDAQETRSADEEKFHFEEIAGNVAQLKLPPWDELAYRCVWFAENSRVAFPSALCPRIQWHLQNERDITRKFL